MQNNGFFQNQSLKVGVDVILSVCRRAFKSGACATQCICLNLFRRLILGPDEDDDSIVEDFEEPVSPPPSDSNDVILVEDEEEPVNIEEEEANVAGKNPTKIISHWCSLE